MVGVGGSNPLGCTKFLYHGIPCRPKSPVNQGFFGYSAFHAVSFNITAYPQNGGYNWGYISTPSA